MAVLRGSLVLLLALTWRFALAADPAPTILW
jgi:hypothetical protein